MTTKSKIALDTNILVYLYDSSDERKRLLSEKLLTEKPIISSQVISEYINVTKRLLKLSKGEILGLCIEVFRQCEIVTLNQQILDRAHFLLKSYDFQIFDSIVVAAALNAGSNVLYSEDLQNGLLVENQLRIVNPFIENLKEPYQQM